MNEVKHNEQFGGPTLGFVLANSAQVRRFVEPETERRAPHDHFLWDSFGLVLVRTVI